MPFAITASVRKLVGNPPTTEVADADIDDYIDGADAFVKSRTMKSDWVSGDTEYEAIETIANLIAASNLLQTFPSADSRARAKDIWSQALAMLDGLKAPYKTVGLGYRTSPLSDSESGDLVEP